MHYPRIELHVFVHAEIESERLNNASLYLCFIQFMYISLKVIEFEMCI